MKRSWIGFALLLVLLVLAVLSTWAMDRIHAPLEEALNQAAQCAQQGDWTNAERLSRQAMENWKKFEDFRGFLADHTPTEEIDSGFATLQVYCHNREPLAFAALCRDLAQKCAAVGEAHGLSWKNIL